MPLTITNKLIIAEAESRGWEHRVVDEKTDLVMIYPPNIDPILLRRARTELSNAVGNYIADEKNATAGLARFFDIPTPQAYPYGTWEDGVKFLNQYGNIVVKPSDAAHGDGVTVGVTDEAGLKKALEYAQEFSKSVILQKYYDGTDYRLLTVGGKLVAAAYRKPAFVVGDGKRTVRELLEEKNQHPWRGKGHHSPLTIIKHEEVSDFIGDDRMDEVPGEGEEVELLGTANLSRGGEAMDVTDQVHPDMRHIAERISREAHLGVCGVDIRCKDISLPTEESDPIIIELNVSPGLRMHHYPSVGEARNVSGMILDEILRRRNQ